MQESARDTEAHFNVPLHEGVDNFSQIQCSVNQYILCSYECDILGTNNNIRVIPILTIGTMRQTYWYQANAKITADMRMQRTLHGQKYMDD